MPDVFPGAVALVVLLSAIATYPLSWLLLALYRRAVRRSMRRRTGADRPQDALLRDVVHDRPASVGIAGRDPGDPDSLRRAMQQMPWRAAAVYALAGTAYAVTMAAVILIATDNWGGPVRFAIMTVVFAWPIVLAVPMVAASTRAPRIILTVGYFVGLFALGAIDVAGNLDASISSGLLLWALYNGPTTIFLATFLARRIRAVGPLVFVFLLLVVVGANVILSVLGVSDASLRAVASPLFDLGLGVTASLLTIAGVGAVLFAVLGWGALTWIRRRYEAKVFSDETVTLDTLWLVFTVSHSLGLLFEHPFAVLAGAIPFVAYVIVGRVTLPVLARYRQAPQRLLLLRSFSIGPEGERLFDSLEKHWRRVGSIDMIAGYDLATRTVEPHEFLDFVSGRIARRFIESPQTFARRLSEMDLAPDRDGRFRVNDFFCYDDTWKMVVSSLVIQSSAVLMDLRGFTRENTGCVAEIHELFRAVPLTRVVFVANARTDETLLTETFAAAAGAAGTTSDPRVLRLDKLTHGGMRELLDLLAHAVQRVDTSLIDQPREIASRLN